METMTTAARLNINTIPHFLQMRASSSADAVPYIFPELG
jgi:hypothetical protein